MLVPLPTVAGSQVKGIATTASVVGSQRITTVITMGNLTADLGAGLYS